MTDAEYKGTDSDINTEMGFLLFAYSRNPRILPLDLYISNFANGLPSYSYWSDSYRSLPSSYDRRAANLEISLAQSEGVIWYPYRKRVTFIYIPVCILFLFPKSNAGLK